MLAFLCWTCITHRHAWRLSAMMLKLLLLVSICISLSRSTQPAATRRLGAKSDKKNRERYYCATCRGPVHSWDTFPVSFHASRPNTQGPITGLELSAKDLATLSKFPLVTLEKWQGDHAYSEQVCIQTGNCSTATGNVFYWQEDAWIAAAQQIKAASPQTSVVVWMDTVLIYTGWTWPSPSSSVAAETATTTYHEDDDPLLLQEEDVVASSFYEHMSRRPPVVVNHTLNPDAKEACTTGHLRAAEFLELPSNRHMLLHNTSGLPALEPWSGCHVYDHSKPQVRQFWMDLCLNLTKTAVIDGCGADFSATGKNKWYWHKTDFIANWLGLDLETAAAWNTGHTQMMSDLTKALGDGILVGKDAAELGDHVNAVLHEGCPPGNGTIHLLQNLTQTSLRIGQRLIYQCHTNRPSVSSMATFLCGAGVDHYYTVGGWNGGPSGFPGHWRTEFERPLGRPLSDCIYNRPTATWTRVFASGTVVRFNATSNEGMIEWSDQQTKTKQEETS